MEVENKLAMENKDRVNNEHLIQGLIIIAKHASESLKLHRDIFLRRGTHTLQKKNNMDDTPISPITEKGKKDIYLLVGLSVALSAKNDEKQHSILKVCFEICSDVLRPTHVEMSESTMKGVKDTIPMLYDHRPRQLSEDDYLRVCRVPKRKGANFRDFPGVNVGADNIARLDPTMERVLLPSGKSLVVHPAPGNANGTLVNAILHHCRLPTVACMTNDVSSESEECSETSGNEIDDLCIDRFSMEMVSSENREALIRPGIVHRLDKGTSGLLVVAKNRNSHSTKAYCSSP